VVLRIVKYERADTSVRPLSIGLFFHLTAEDLRCSPSLLPSLPIALNFLVLKL
jgi:hypothetical protein